MRRSEALAYRLKIEHAAAQQNDEDALNSIELFHQWSANEDVTLHQRVKDLNADEVLTLYECITAHHTQSDWRPKDTPALWKVVSIEEWPEIPEHIPSTSPWNAGDKGTWKGQHYICQMDGCVWNPDEYPTAWKLVNNE